MMRTDRTCRRWRRALAASVDGTAGLEQRRALKRHLDECAACREEHEVLIRTRRAVQMLEPECAPRELAYRIQSSLQGQRRARSPFDWFGVAAGAWVVRGLSVAAVAAILVFAWQLKGGHQTGDYELPEGTPVEMASASDAARADLVHDAWEMQQVAADAPFVDRAVADFTYAVSWQHLTPARSVEVGGTPAGRVRNQ